MGTVRLSGSCKKKKKMMIITRRKRAELGLYLLLLVTEGDAHGHHRVCGAPGSWRSAPSVGEAVI